MKLVRKYWSFVFIIMASVINFTITNPLENKCDQFFNLGLDLMYEHDGIIDEIDQSKYCDLLSEISKESSSNCEDNLNKWRDGYAKNRLKTYERLDNAEKVIEQKIEISEWFSWGVIFVFIVLTYLKQRKEKS